MKFKKALSLFMTAVLLSSRVPLNVFAQEIVAPSEIELISENKQADEKEYSIDYRILSDWGSGLSAQIVITNNTDIVYDRYDWLFNSDAKFAVCCDGDLFALEACGVAQSYFIKGEENIQVYPSPKVTLPPAYYIESAK